MTLLKLNDSHDTPYDLSKHTYLVTGAANGIGRSVATALADSKAAVILLDKDERQLEQVYDSISKNASAEPVIVHQDLTLLTQNHCDVLFTQIKQAFQKLDGIIHCAVETGNLSPIMHYSEEDWSKVIRANLHSPYLLTRTLFPLLSHDGPSAVLFSSSEQALKSSAYWGAFGVAFQGLKGLMETWSQEIENTRVQMFTLDPGKVNTGFLVRLFPGINPNHFHDSNIVAQKYLQLLMHATTSRELHGQFIQLNDLQFEIV